MPDDLFTALARQPDLFVIARERCVPTRRVN